MYCCAETKMQFTNLFAELLFCWIVSCLWCRKMLKNLVLKEWSIYSHSTHHAWESQQKPHLSTSSVSSFAPPSRPIRLLSGSLCFFCFPESFVAHKYVYVCRTPSAVQACSQMWWICATGISDVGRRRQARLRAAIGSDERKNEWLSRSSQSNVMQHGSCRTTLRFVFQIDGVREQDDWNEQSGVHPSFSMRPSGQDAVESVYLEVGEWIYSGEWLLFFLELEPNANRAES